MDAVHKVASVRSASKRDEQWPSAVAWIFVPQMALSLAYACFLWLANIYDETAVHSYIEAVSGATRWLAGLLPISRYADAIANPAISLSAELIRHVFPVLVALNLIPGAVGFLFTKPLSAYYALRVNPKAFDTGYKIYLFLVAVPIYLLFLDPVIAVDFKLHAAPMSLYDYFIGSISPALLFYAVVQANAMNRARRKISI